jgi:hypothetical protein
MNGSLALGCLLTAAMLLPADAASTTESPCSDSAYRQFDFWIGHWQVSVQDGRKVGENLITPVQGGCALREQYSTPGGYAGESLTAYDARRSIWHQTWVDTQGQVLLLQGRRVGSDMVLESRSASRSGHTAVHRIRWTPLDDGSVRQHWQRRKGSQPWETVFDGYYRRLDGAP